MSGVAVPSRRDVYLIRRAVSCARRHYAEFCVWSLGHGVLRPVARAMVTPGASGLTGRLPTAPDSRTTVRGHAAVEHTPPPPPRGRTRTHA